MRLEIIDQRRPPRLAAGCVAQRVELERHPIRNPQFFQQLIRHRQQFDIGLRLARTDDLGIQLVKLAIPPFLRAFVAEQRPVGRHL